MGLPRGSARGRGVPDRPLPPDRGVATSECPEYPLHESIDPALRATRMPCRRPPADEAQLALPMLAPGSGLLRPRRSCRGPRVQPCSLDPPDRQSRIAFAKAAQVDADHWSRNSARPRQLSLPPGHAMSLPWRGRLPERRFVLPSWKSELRRRLRPLHYAAPRFYVLYR